MLPACCVRRRADQGGSPGNGQDQKNSGIQAEYPHPVHREGKARDDLTDFRLLHKGSASVNNVCLFMVCMLFTLFVRYCNY